MSYTVNGTCYTYINTREDYICMQLEEKISQYYVNAYYDYGVRGMIDSCIPNLEDDDCKISCYENGELMETTIDCFSQYSLEQLYSIWIETH